MLNIQKVILSEFCQHASLELELSSGLTGLFGPNGCGKSNIANAICGAFTGDFSRHSEGAKGCIRQNQPNDAYVEIHGTIAEQPFRLRRDITRKGVKHSLWLNGDKHRMYDKAGDIETWLTDVSGLTPQIMAEFLFIGQQDLYGFLETTDAQRSRKFAALCGTRGYEHRRDVYNDFLKRDRATAAAETSVSVEFLEAAIRKTRDELDTVHGAVAELQESHGDPGGKIEQLETRLGKLSKKMQDLQERKFRVMQYTVELAQANEELSQWHTELAKTRLAESTLAKKVAESHNRCETAGSLFHQSLAGRTLADVLAELRDVQKQLIGYDKLVEQLDKAESSLKNLAEPEPFDAQELGTTQELKEKSDADLVRVTEKMKSTEQLFHTLKQLKGHRRHALSDCPLCGADASHWNVDLSSLEDTLDELKNEAGSLEARITESEQRIRFLEGQRSQVERYRQKHDSLTSEIARFKIEINHFSGLDTDRDIDTEIDTLLARQKTTDDLAHQHRILLSQQGAEKDKIDRLAGQIDCAKKRTVALADTLTAIGKSEDELQELLSGCEIRVKRMRDEIKTLRELENQLNVLQGSKQAAENRLAELREKLTERQAAQESQGSTAAWLTKFETALNWLKKDGLPRHIHRAVLDQLVSTINRELTCFDGSFEVSVNEDLTFTATFPDGVRSIAKDLSGGQKVMLAMAFWSAINRTFAQNLGIMILDEPTDGLDQENKQSLYRIMEEWAKLLRHRGQQVMIITHDTDMEDSFDSVLVLESQVSGEAV